MDRCGHTEESKEWIEVKKVVRSVLLSDVKSGLKLATFVHRYRELYNTPLEPRKFGFNSPLDLLKAMPDVVRFESSVQGMRLHAEVENMDNVYLTPALRRTAQRLKKEFAFSSDSESDYRPRKKVPCFSDVSNKPYRNPFNDFQRPHAISGQIESPKEETDPMRRDIAEQMKPNTRGYYAILVPRIHINSAEDIEEVFGKYGEIKDVSRTERYCFIRYQHRHEAVSAVLHTWQDYGTGVPQEKGNPQRVIKAKDISNKPSCSRQIANDASAPLIAAGGMKEENFEDIEIFVGNINLSSAEADVLNLFSNYEIKKKRFVTKDIKRFAFLTVGGLDTAYRICNDLHKTVFDGRELVVQVSYINTNESMPAIQPDIPETDRQRFMNSAPKGVYKQLTNFADKYDSDEEEETIWKCNQGRIPDSGAQITVNVPNLVTLEDEMPDLEDDHERTVMYYPSNSTYDSDMEIHLDNGATEYDVVLEQFPHHTHYKQIYLEFRKIGIERVKVNVVSNFPPHPTLAIATFDNEASVQEALKWNGKDFNCQPMYIRRLDPNNEQDMAMLNRVQSARKNERSVHMISPRGRGVRANYNRGFPQSRGPPGHRGRGLESLYLNAQNRGHHMGQRGTFNPGRHPGRQFVGRGNMNRQPAPHGYQALHNPGPRGSSRPPRFPNMRPPYPRGFSHRGRGQGHREEHHDQYSHPPSQGDPFEPTKEDYTLSKQMDDILKDCFPGGCLPWISKDLPEKSEVHIAEIISENYFFGHVKNGLPGIELKEMTNKMREETFIDGALAYTDTAIRRVAAWYSHEGEPEQLFRAWIKEFYEDGECQVFFIDWANTERQPTSDMLVIKDVYWIMRPQIVLFKIDDTSEVQKDHTYTLRVRTKNVYESNYVVPVELISS